MFELSGEDVRSLVEEARLAPSVHNVQPSRWRISGQHGELWGHPGRAIPVGDPHWRDWWLSHGAALEGFDIALGRRGLAMQDLAIEAALPPESTQELVPVAQFLIVPGERRPAPPVESRASWRGSFAAGRDPGRVALERIATAREDVIVITERRQIAQVAALAERANMHFLRQEQHRAELRRWLRLSRWHPCYERDGLNAQALRLGALEALAAGWVLGGLFAPLDRIGLAGLLLSEASKSRTAAGFVLLHRPLGEHPVRSGRAFYQAWLDMEQQGLKACPVSVLVDWPQSRAQLAHTCAVPPERQIISVFRAGYPSRPQVAGHARLPASDLILDCGAL